MDGRSDPERSVDVGVLAVKQGGGRVRFEIVDPVEIDWPSLDGFADRTFCQRAGWLAYLQRTQRGEVIVARLEDDGATLGYFTGLIVRRFGIRIMGSPFPGWTTPFMGFNLAAEVPRGDAVRALLPFVFHDLGCMHLELSDPYLTRSDLASSGFTCDVGSTFVTDLRLTEEQILGSMESSTRRALRKGEKSGLAIEEASPAGFAADYFEHLTDVFAKQNLRPTYDQARIAALVESVHPSGDLLLVRARDPDGRSIATGIFPGYGAISFFFGNGSLREYQILRPNEAIHWYALRYWRARGVVEHNWGGAGDYKAKYGGRRVETLHFRLSRNAAIGIGREVARSMYYAPRRLMRRRHLARVARTR